MYLWKNVNVINIEVTNGTVEKHQSIKIYVCMWKNIAQNYKEKIFYVNCSRCAALLWHKMASSGACMDKLAWVFGPLTLAAHLLK